MPSLKKSRSHTNGKIKKSQEVENSAYLNTPMSGIFDSFGPGPGAAASNSWEMQNTNSYQLISLQRVVLTYAYVLNGPLRTLVDQPVSDAFRGGIKITSDEVSPEELEDLHREIKKSKLIRKIVEAMRWDRLYGGAAIIINTNQDYKTRFDVKKVTEDTKLEFIAVDRHELSWSGVPDAVDSTFIYANKIHSLHQSRVVRIVGEEAPSLVRQRLSGWGMSVIECVIREISAYFKNNNVIFELLDEAKIDVWKINGFNTNILTKGGQSITTRRIQMATYMKSFLNAITLDKEDDYEQKTMTFQGLASMLEQIRIGMAAACRMPMAKLFGLASQGFASGEDDIENYNAIVEGQRDRADDILDVVIPIEMMKVWGFVPDDWKTEYRPLRVLTAEQEEGVKTEKYNRFNGMYHDGILTPKEYCQVLKEEKLLMIETEVSKGAEPQPPMLSMGLGEEGPGGGGESTSKPSDGKNPTKAKV